MLLQRHTLITAVAGFIALNVATPAIAAQAPDVRQLALMSLEELSNVEVSTASRVAAPLNESAAAAYVITRDDIRRAGVTTLPEALRLAPGVEVARSSSQGWAITMRGFNGDLANKLLVLIDGRSVYSPLFAGVFWDVQDMLFDDIERIEVIAGPGGTLWGANAVNGVINIITRSSAATQGGLIEAGGGNQDRAIAGARFGGEVGDATARAYVKYFDRDEFRRLPDGRRFEDWQMLQGGFRVDHDASLGQFTWQGDAYRGEKGSLIDRDFVRGTLPAGARALETQLRGANLLGRFTRSSVGGSELAVQLYVDMTERDIPFTYAERRTTTDLDVQQRLPMGGRHDVLWGAGIRSSSDHLDSTTFATFTPADRTDLTVSGFVQDRVALTERLFLTLGTKLEHNDYTGTEFQPNVRLAWLPDSRQTFWAAASRAVRIPSRLDSDLRFTVPLAIPGIPVPLYAQVDGSSDFDAERLIAYESGWRLQALDDLHFDVALFYNDYDRLQTQEPLEPFVVPGPPNYIVLPNVLVNGKHGWSHGGTLLVTWQPLPAWRLKFDYSYFDLDIHPDPGTRDRSIRNVEGVSPRHQLQVQSYIDLAAPVSLFLAARYVDELATGNVDAYYSLDASLQWRVTEDIELSLSGQGLLEPKHYEFGTSAANAIERTLYGNVTWRF